MEIVKVEKGQSAGLPCSVVGGSEGFTHNIPAPCDGVFVRLKDGEGAGGGLFIPAAMLKAAGYVLATVDKDQVTHMVALFDRSELVEIASRLGMKASGTKQALARRILYKF